MAASDPAHAFPPAGPAPAESTAPSSIAASVTASVASLLRFSAVMAVLLAVASLPASSLVTVRTVTVEDARTVSPSAILARAAVRPGDRLLGVSPAAVARAVETVPAVARADVTVGLDGTVTIRVAERVEVAAVPVRGVYLIVDRSGIVIGARAAPGALLVVTSSEIPPDWIRPGQRLPSRGAREGLEAIEDLPAAVRVPGTTVRVEPTGDLVLITADRITVRLGRRPGLRERAAVLVQLLKAVRDRGLALEYMDLRFAGSVVVKPAAGHVAGDQP